MNTNLTNTLTNVLKIVDTTGELNVDSKKFLLSLSDSDFATATLFISYLNQIVKKLPNGVQDFEMLDIEFKQLNPVTNLDQVIINICNVKGFNNISDIENFLVSVGNPITEDYIKNATKFKSFIV
jgi:hypothetical protein